MGCVMGGASTGRANAIRLRQTLMGGLADTQACELVGLMLPSVRLLMRDLFARESQRCRGEMRDIGRI